MTDPRPGLHTYPLFDALRFRRSRRFGLGMHLEHGPMSYKSAHAPMPLSEEEEAYLAARPAEQEDGEGTAQLRALGYVQ